MRTGAFTSPKLMLPLQIARGREGAMPETIRDGWISRESRELLLPRLHRGVVCQGLEGGTGDDGAVGREPGAVAGAVPAPLGGIPGDHAAEVGAGRGDDVQPSGGLAVHRRPA